MPPLTTASFVFFICSTARGFRFGLLRSATRKVGCAPLPLGTNGWAGSFFTGFAPDGASRKSWFIAIQEEPSEPKSGAAPVCADAPVTVNATTAVLARNIERLNTERLIGLSLIEREIKN